MHMMHSFHKIFRNIFLLLESIYKIHFLKEGSTAKTNHR